MKIPHFINASVVDTTIEALVAECQSLRTRTAQPMDVVMGTDLTFATGGFLHRTRFVLVNDASRA